MNSFLKQIKEEIYDKFDFEITNFKTENESQDYDACQFVLNGKKIISRTAKITPKKVGQFVTFWKRNEKGTIEPYFETVDIDFYVINVHLEREFGQFVIPKDILIKKGIISTTKKEGKRGFRVYPTWDIPKNNQALKTQKWQLNYFYILNETIEIDVVKDLYKLN